MHIKAYITIALTGCLTYANAWFNADKNEFFGTSKRGWHYFEKLDENKTDLVEQKRQTDTQDERFMSSIPINDLSLLTAEQFTQTFEKARKIAVMKPTKQNVAIVQKMNKWQIDQSELFAKVWTINNFENPNLEFPEIETSAIGIESRKNKQKAKQDKFFEDKKENLGFVVFVNGLNQEVNSRQKAVYDSLQRIYDIEVEYIDIDTNQDFIKALNLITTPENFFIYKNSKDEVIWQRIKSGFVTREDILNNTMFLFENTILKDDK